MSNPGSRAPLTARPRVLFVDDNLTQLDLYAFVLHHDLRVLTATRGEDGYALACAERPDAVVIDCVLPDVDGLAICERLVANPGTATVPLLVLTGDDRAYERAMTMRLLDAVLRKPCPADVLLRAVLQAISVRAIR